MKTEQVSLAIRCNECFSASVQRKGDSYQRNGRVSIFSYEGGGLFAEVKGSQSRPYQVELDWTQPNAGIIASCTCPHYEEGNLCKHIWATLAQMDDEGLSNQIPGKGPVFVLREDDEESYEDDYDEDEWFDEDDDFDDFHDLWEGSGKRVVQVRRTSGNGRAAIANMKQQPRSWYEELAAEPAPTFHGGPYVDQSTSSSKPRTVQYVLDVSASFSAGALVIQFYQRELRKDGAWGKTKPLRVRRQEIDAFAPQDAEVLGLACGNYVADPGKYDRSYGYAPHYIDYDSISQVELTPASQEILLPKLCATERFGWVLGTQQPPEDATTLTWDDGPAWRPRLRIEADDRGEKWTVRGELSRDTADGNSESVPLGQPVLLLRSGIVLFEDRIARLARQVDFRWVSLLRQHDQIEVPYSDRHKLLEQVWGGPDPIEVAWPENLDPQVVTAQPTGYLKVHAAEDQSKLPSWQRKKVANLYADVAFDYGEQQIAYDNTNRAIVDLDSERVLCRDRETESKLMEQLRDLRVKPKSQTYYNRASPGHWEFPRQRLPEIVAQLVNNGWRVDAEGHRIRSAGEFNLRVTSGVDWFDLESHVEFGDEVASLPALLAAAKAGESYVTLGDGSRGMLPQKWLDRFAPLAEFAEVEGDRLRFKPSQALLLDTLLADRQQEYALEVDRQFQTFCTKLKSFSGIEPATAPRGFRGELRGYQQEGLGWLKFLEEFQLGGCLADDMGLGKTVQVLALLLARRQRRLKQGEQRLPSLVVAPKSVVFNWELEAERFAPTLSVLNYTGLERHEWQEELADHHVILTTYGTLRRDIETLGQMQFDYVILDEAQAIKNDQSQTAKASRLLRAEHRLTLTGTPVENHLGELWSQFEFLNPGMLGRSSAFHRLSKSLTNGDRDQSDDEKPALESFRRGLAPFILRRTKEQVLTDLPEKNEQTLYCELLPHDRKKYDELRAYYRDSLLKRIDDDGMNKAKMHVLEALLRLRQTACHPGLVDKKLAKKPSAKLTTLVDQLTEVAEEGHKALVFSQFTSLLAIVRDRLDKQGVRYEYLDGRTRKRQEKVNRFQTDPDCPAFLISLKAGGTGLNLTAADYVFLLDPWWNPAVEAQAIDRAHRIGQTRRVFAYRLIARDTVEEKIVELQAKKRELADAVISGSGAVLSQLTVEDLQLLLS